MPNAGNPLFSNRNEQKLEGLEICIAKPSQCVPKYRSRQIKENRTLCTYFTAVVLILNMKTKSMSLFVDPNDHQNLSKWLVLGSVGCIVSKKLLMLN